ncbi:MAG TPA: hypothetical protein VGO99_09195, partial [Leifsonia sp.]|nr:hypothetical protein [Leifsonia sp.]
MPRIARILLLGHTHHDVGYTNSPRIIDRMHAQIVQHVLDLAEQNRGGQDAADRFRWTFEVARPVLEFLRTASPHDIARLRSFVADGTISVTGGYLNMTQLPGEREFDAAYDALCALRDAGIPVRTEQHGDVNGIAWGAVDGMRRAGIDRLVMALNPDHGRPPFEQPSGFWWESPAGGRVFTWLSTHYGFGEEWGIVDGDVELAEQRILEFIEGLEERDDYPFDTAVVHAGNDNRWPTTLFLDVVRHWNAQHPERPLSTATIDTALDALVAQAGDPGSGVLPVARGEWSDWWSHGHGSTAREVAVYREARTFAQSAATSLALTRLRGDGQPALATVLGYRRGPARLRTDDEVIDELAGVDKELLLFGEHTWGSWETYSKPHSFFSHSHWNAKAGFAYGAFDWARDLAIEGVYRYAASGCGSSGATGETEETDETGETGSSGDTDETPGDSILVFNPTERDRREPVEVEIGGARRVTIVAEAGGFGVTAIPIPDAADAPRAGRSFETDRYRLEVDPDRGGVISLVDRASGRELVDRASAHGLGAIVVEQVAEGSTHPMLTNPKEFRPAHPGPEFV